MTGERVEFGVRVVGGEFVLATYRTRREAVERIGRVLEPCASPPLHDLIARVIVPPAPALEIVQRRVTPWELAETEENR